MSIDQIAILVSSIGVLVTLIIFVLQSRNQTLLRRAEFILRLEDKYDQICLARMQNPKMMRCAGNWQHKPYDEMTDDEKAFYHYCEMALGFIEMCVYLNKVAKTLPDSIFDTFVAPMIRLELSYNAEVLVSIAEKEGLPVESKELLRRFSPQIGHL